MCVGQSAASVSYSGTVTLAFYFCFEKGPLTDLERTNQPRPASQRALRILLCCLSSAGAMNMPQHTLFLSLFYISF